MSNAAKVGSIDAIRQFRAALIKFAEEGNAALSNADSEVGRKLMWLETEQQSFWAGQMRKWQEQVSRAKEALRMKKLFKDSFGRQQSAVEEEKQLRKAQRMFDESEQKLAATRAAAKLLQREHLMFRGAIQQLGTRLSSDVPNSIALLDAITAKLDEYAAASPTLATSTAAGPAATGGFSQSGDVMSKPVDEPDADGAEKTEAREASDDPDAAPPADVPSAAAAEHPRPVDAHAAKNAHAEPDAADAKDPTRLPDDHVQTT